MSFRNAGADGFNGTPKGWAPAHSSGSGARFRGNETFCAMRKYLPPSLDLAFVGASASSHITVQQRRCAVRFQARSTWRPQCFRGQETQPGGVIGASKKTGSHQRTDKFSIRFNARNVKSIFPAMNTLRGLGGATGVHRLSGAKGIQFDWRSGYPRPSGSDEFKRRPQRE